jgi:hypothetical protein
LSGYQVREIFGVRNAKEKYYQKSEKNVLKVLLYGLEMTSAQSCEEKGEANM